MGKCDGHHHTSTCSFRSILLCLLFHIHIHSCHGADLESTAPPQQPVSTAALGIAAQLDGNDTDSVKIGNETSFNGSASESLQNIDFLKRLFKKYGDGNEISFEAFTHLLENLGLSEAPIRDRSPPDVLLVVNGSENTVNKHLNHTMGNEEERKHFNISEKSVSKKKETVRCDNSTIVETDIGNHGHHHENIRHRRSRSQQRKRRWDSHGREKREIEDSDIDKCYSPKEILENYHRSTSESIGTDTFLELCPSLIYQLDIRLCSSEDDVRGQRDESYRCDDSQDQGDETVKPFWNTSLTVWGYAFLSVLVISLVGLLSVAVIPLTTKVFYNHLLQFLVALAVGSLTGDACLHLLPHALSPHDHSPENDSHHSESGSAVRSREAMWKGLVVLSGIYFFFLMERLMGLITAKTRKNNKEKRDISPQIYKPIKDREKDIGSKLNGQTTKVMSCEEILMVVHPSKDLRNLAEDAHDEVHENCDLDLMDHGQVQGFSQAHGHSHHHGPLPSSVSSVAWMVIMGDGLHNFSDGLAIGAAFANSLTGGLSTSVAVFCHELPHELGDFAVLLRAGMRPKQAIVYNLVSSVLCLFGMVVGVAVGNLSEASLWIFAMIGGSFIYIALVDMLPEMIAVDPKAGEHPLIHLVLQNIGLLAGAAIMLIIAMYEDQIKIPHWEP